eukprot:s2007_g14.t1
MPCATTPAPTEDGRPKPRTARGKTPKDAEDPWFQVMLQDAHGVLHLPTPEIKEQLHGIPAGYTAGAGADAKTRHRMLGVAGFLRLLAMVVWSACGRSLWPPFPDRHHRRPLPTLDWLTAAWRTHGWDFSPPPPPPGVLAFRPRWRHDLVRIRDEVICQLRERVQDAADLTADWLQGDLFALPVFLRLLEDLGYATAALRQDLEDGFDMLGEVRQAPLEAAGRRAVRQPVPPGNSPGEGGWLASPGFRHDLQNAYRQWAVKHPGHCGTFLPSAAGTTLWFHFAMCFGAAASVWNFNRAADAVPNKWSYERSSWSSSATTLFARRLPQQWMAFNDNVAGQLTRHEYAAPAEWSTRLKRLNEKNDAISRGDNSRALREGWHRVHAPVDDVMEILAHAAVDIDFACHVAPERLCDLAVLNDPLADSTGHVEIRQKWFLADGSSEPSDDDKTWFCPVIVGTDKGTSPAGFLEEKSGKIACASCLPGASMIKVNFGQHVPVRVLYPESVFKRLVQNLSSVPPEDKIGLLSDTFSMSKAGVLDASFLVDLLAGFKSELNDNVWSEISAVLGGLEKVVCQGLADDTAQAFKEFCSKLVVPAFTHETASADSDNRKKLRSTVLAAVSKYCSQDFLNVQKADHALHLIAMGAPVQDPTISAEAVRRCKEFAASPNDPTVLSADIRSSVFDVALQSDHAALAFDELVRAHEVVTDGAVKIHIYGALGKAGGAALQQKALDFCLSGAVRSQDLIYIPMAMATSGKTGADTVFSWMQSEYNRIYDMIGATSMMLFQNMVRVSGAGFVTESKAEEVAAFWKSRDVYKNIEKALAQTVEGIKSNSKFVDRLRGSKAALASTWKSAMANSNLCKPTDAGDKHVKDMRCKHIQRVTYSRTHFLTFADEAKGVETMLSFLRHLPQAHVAPNTSEAVNAAAAAMFQRAACWLNDVDEVDFDQLQHVLYLAFWLGAEDEDVALSALDAIERFTLYRSENGATLLQSDVLQVLHRIIGHNRAPELVSEAFTLLYRLCDAPAPAVVPLMTEESGLVRTVVESMLQAPLNMRLQLAGVRLLALWAQFDVAEDPEAEGAMSDQKDLKQFVREANAAEVAKEVAANLTRAGLTHAASWMSAISSRLPKRVQGSKGSKEPREPKASKGSKDEHGPRSASKASGSSRAKSK